MTATPPDQNVDSAVTTFADDELVQLQLRVAQRADELAQKDGPRRERDLEHWLQAEREVFAAHQAPVAMVA